MDASNTIDGDFWEYLDHLFASHKLVIDRPRGSAHPRFPGMIYPLDYGYLEGTTTVDGGGLDVWMGSDPERRLGALALTVDLYKRDAEIKLLVGCTPEDLQVILEAINSYSMRGWLVPRELGVELLRSRRSVRHFEPRPVPRSLLDQVLELATRAPSAHNRQPWRFAALVSAQVRLEFAQAIAVDFRRDLLADGLADDEVRRQVNRSIERIHAAPVAVVLCQDDAGGDPYPDQQRQDLEVLMGVQSVALAGGQLLLAAHALGLGGVWMCAPLFAQEATSRTLDLPKDWRPQALILLGYPVQTPPERPRRPLDEVAVFR